MRLKVPDTALAVASDIERRWRYRTES